MRAGERGPSGSVFAHEVRDDVLLKLLLEVQDVVRDIDRRGHTPRIVKVVERAAAAERPGAVGLRGDVVELHR